MWYAVINDLVGGWCVANVDLPLSAIRPRTGERVIGDFMTEDDARRVARLLNQEEDA